MIIVLDPQLKLLIIAFIESIVVGAIIGWLVSLRFEGFGLIGNIVVGVLGATLGGLASVWLLPRIGIIISGDGVLTVLANTVFGAIVGAWLLLRVSRAALARRGIR